MGNFYILTRLKFHYLYIVTILKNEAYGLYLFVANDARFAEIHHTMTHTGVLQYFDSLLFVDSCEQISVEQRLFDFLPTIGPFHLCFKEWTVHFNSILFKTVGRRFFMPWSCSKCAPYAINALFHGVIVFGDGWAKC